jgi:hypothetical protein
VIHTRIIQLGSLESQATQARTGWTTKEARMKAEAQKEHQWFQKLMGEWICESEMSAGAGQPPVKYTGTETVRALGDVWFLAEAQGEMPGGGPTTTVMTLGYDPQKKRYVGTFIGSMMTFLWIYDGELDASERVLTLHTEGPSMSGDGTMRPYKDVIELQSDDHRTLSGYVQADDGTWQQFMTMSYRRKQ